jgi:putative hydrolase of the HAD superfamily
MSIKAVAFDYGGVISFFQDGETMKDLADLAGTDAALMTRIYWENRSGYDQGLVDGKGFFKNILAGVGIFADPDLLEKLIRRDLESWSHINPKTEALIRDIKTSGFKTAVLSNMVQDFLDRVKNTLPVFGLFDAAVFSCEVGALKPEEKIYRILLSQLDCEADELIFFDDLEENVLGAQALGIQAFLWKGPEEARKELEIFGLAVP